MRKSYKTEAFVLKKRPLLKSDLFVSLFTEKLGLIKVFAPGIKKITSKRVSILETGNLIKTELSQKDNFFYLSEVSLVSGFTSIKDYRDKMNTYYVFLFVLAKILPEEAAEEKIFKLFKSFLVELSSQTGHSLPILTRYLNQVLKVLGYLEKDLTEYEITPFIEDLINEKLPDFNI